MRIAIGLQLLIVLAALVCSASADKELLQRLCAKDVTAEVTSIAQVKSLIATLEGEPEIKDCKKEVKQSILDLKPVIEIDNVCSLEGVQRIVKYYYDHVHKKMLKFKQDKQVRRTPSGIKKFFVAYGLQASRLCRNNLLENLAAATEANIPADDMRFVTEFIDDSSKNYQIMRGKRARLEDLVLLGDVTKNMSRRKSKKMLEEEKEAVVGTAVSAENKAKIDDIKRRCAEKFKPIYDQLIVPVVQLAYLGFNYTDPQSADSYRQFEATADYENWFKAVLVCDTALRLRVVAIESVKDMDQAALLTEDEFARAQQLKDSNSTEPNALKPIKFKRIVRIDDSLEVLNSSNAHPVRAIKHYNPMSARNCGDLLKRVAQNLPGLVRHYVETGRLSFGLKDVSGDTLKHPNDISKFGHSARAKRWLTFTMRFTLVAGIAMFVGFWAAVLGTISGHVPSILIIGLLIGWLVSWLVFTASKNSLKLDD